MQAATWVQWVRLHADEADEGAFLRILSFWSAACPKSLHDNSAWLIPPLASGVSCRARSSLRSPLI